MVNVRQTFGTNWRLETTATTCGWYWTGFRDPEDQPAIGVHPDPALGQAFWTRRISWRLALTATKMAGVGRAAGDWRRLSGSQGLENQLAPPSCWMGPGRPVEEWYEQHWLTLPLDVLDETRGPVEGWYEHWSTAMTGG